MIVHIFFRFWGRRFWKQWYVISEKWLLKGRWVLKLATIQKTLELPKSPHQFCKLGCKFEKLRLNRRHQRFLHIQEKNQNELLSVNDSFEHCTKGKLLCRKTIARRGKYNQDAILKVCKTCERRLYCMNKECHLNKKLGIEEKQERLERKIYKETLRK